MPSISERKQHLETLWRIHRKNVDHLEIRMAESGGSQSLELINQLEQEQARMLGAQAQLATDGTDLSQLETNGALQVAVLMQRFADGEERSRDQQAQAQDAQKQWQREQEEQRAQARTHDARRWTFVLYWLGVISVLLLLLLARTVFVIVAG